MEMDGKMPMHIDAGKVATDGKSGMDAEKMKGAVMKMKSAADEILQMLGPDTSQDMDYEKDNPAMTKGDPKRADSMKNMRRSAIMSKLSKMK